MKKILVLGSINIDQVIEVNKLPLMGETIIAKAIHYHFGGKGANQAVTLANMNCFVTLLSIVGNDDYGKNSLSNFVKYNININHIKISKTSPTGLASIYLQDNGLNSIVVLPGANNEVNEIYVKQNKWLIDECDAFLAQLETDSMGVFTALAIAKKAEKITFLNPSPAFELTKEHLMNCDFIILNELELQTIAKVKINQISDIKKACKKLNKISPTTKIVVTFKKEGVFYFDNLSKELLHYPIVETNVIDTTAANDSFIGGFVSQIVDNKSVGDSIKFGLKVVSKTISKKGSQESIPFLKEII